MSTYPFPSSLLTHALLDVDGDDDDVDADDSQIVDAGDDGDDDEEE